MTTPIWLLDVDGVLNALPHRRRDDVWPDYTKVQCAPGPNEQVYTITFSPTLMKRIRKLHESGAVEVRWLTTWGHGANYRLNKLLGLPEFEIAGEPQEVSGYGGTAWTVHRWWKFGDAWRTHAVEPDRPIIWTDDDLNAVPEALEWADDIGALAICTNISTGLTPDDMDRIEKFVSATEEPAA